MSHGIILSFGTTQSPFGFNRKQRSLLPGLNNASNNLRRVIQNFSVDSIAKICMMVLYIDNSGSMPRWFVDSLEFSVAMPGAGTQSNS
jgi:hypothetical protein